MENLIRNTTALAKFISDNYINSQSVVVDATTGNGNDTLYYAKKCRFVYGFDIQQVAVDNTEKLLKENNCDNYKLILDSHQNMKNYINEAVDLIMFNLGYLPCGDKEITTKTESTLTALRASLDLLKKNGLVCVVLYYGHPQGQKEREEVIKFSKKLDSSIYHVNYIQSINQSKNPPEIVLITKKK